jgi:hypothetical protein
MLLPSILRLLADNHVQVTAVRSAESGFKAEMDAAVEGISVLGKHESESADDAISMKPKGLDQSLIEKPQTGQSLEELLRIINKFQRPNPKRVVDFFE